MYNSNRGNNPLEQAKNLIKNHEGLKEYITPDFKYYTDLRNTEESYSKKERPLADESVIEEFQELLSKYDGKKESTDNKEKIETIQRTKFDYDGFHYAQFSDNGIFRFLKYKNSECEIVDHVIISDPENPDKEYKVVPAPQIAQTKKDRILQKEALEIIKFPYVPRDYGTEYELYSQIKAFIHAFVELRSQDEILLSLYTMKAVLFDALKDSSFPFVHVLAPYGKGKSRLLFVLCEMAPYGFYSIDIKSAPLKRVSELYLPLLFVDEKADMDNDTSAMVNAKYNRNSVIINASKEIQQGFSSIIGYSIYGPMVMAGRSPFNDDAIESKSLQVNMDFPLNRTDIPRKIKGKEYDSFITRALEIRAKLLQFRIKWHDRINEVQPDDFLKKYEEYTEPRLFEVICFFEDLLSIIPEIRSEIKDVLEYQIVRNVEVQKETPDGMIADIILSLIDSGESTISYVLNGKAYSGIRLSSIWDEVGKNYRQKAGMIISKLGLKTDRPRIEINEGKGETSKKRISVVRIPNERKLNELKSRYDPEYIKSILSCITKDDQETLDKLDNLDEHMRNTQSNEEGEGYSLNVRPVRPDSPDLNTDTEKKRVQSYLVISEFILQNKLMKEGEHVKLDPFSEDTKLYLRELKIAPIREDSA